MKRNYRYSSHKENGKRILEHVFVWTSHFGKIPDGLELHHIDGDRGNNVVDNLMLVTHLEHIFL